MIFMAESRLSKTTVPILSPDAAKGETRLGDDEVSRCVSPRYLSDLSCTQAEQATKSLLFLLSPSVALHVHPCHSCIRFVLHAGRTNDKVTAFAFVAVAVHGLQ